ncbi:hypothetical protein C2W62_24815 [Candidatus Entotheonella serta]|nr:hypothetical protein C2W62_24815 [Candidatus Entotheonella serta]
MCVGIMTLKTEILQLPLAYSFTYHMHKRAKDDLTIEIIFWHVFCSLLQRANLYIPTLFSQFLLIRFVHG